MAPPVTATYTLAVAAFVVGVGIALRLLSAGDVDADRGGFRYLLIIPGFAGLTYVAMALNVGTVTVGSESIVLPRYVDWVVTTPVLVGYVGYVAGAPRRWIAGVMAADALMIVTGAAATILPPPTKWALFAVSASFHLALFAVLYAVFPTYAREQRKRWGLFKLLQNHVGLLWIAYPVVWLVGAPGLGYVSAAGLSLVVAYLDVAAKVPYVYFVWNRRHSFDQDAGIEVGTTPEPVGSGTGKETGTGTGLGTGAGAGAGSGTAGGSDRTTR